MGLVAPEVSYNTMWGPPVISWFIKPITIVVGIINHS